MLSAKMCFCYSICRGLYNTHIYIIHMHNIFPDTCIDLENTIRREAEQLCHSHTVSLRGNCLFSYFFSFNYTCGILLRGQPEPILNGKWYSFCHFFPSQYILKEKNGKITFLEICFIRPCDKECLLPSNVAVPDPELQREATPAPIL
jgi:hypothetical protein